MFTPAFLNGGSCAAAAYVVAALCLILYIPQKFLGFRPWLTVIHGALHVCAVILLIFAGGSYEWALIFTMFSALLGILVSGKAPSGKKESDGARKEEERGEDK